MLQFNRNSAHNKVFKHICFEKADQWFYSCSFNLGVLLFNTKDNMVQTSQFIFTIKLLFLCLGLVSKSQQISALRLGKDSEDNDIGIVYSDGNYYVIYKETFQYRNSDFTFCFRHRPVEDVSSTNCQLGNSTGPFDCISYDPSTNGYNQWAMDSDY